VGKLRVVHPTQEYRCSVGWVTLYLSTIAVAVRATCLGSSLWRKWVISVAVPLANLTLLVVDQDLALLVDRNASCVIDRFSLGIELFGNFTVTSASNSPFIIMRNDMLVLACHGKYLCVTMVERGGLHRLSAWATASRRSRKGARPCGVHFCRSANA